MASSAPHKQITLYWLAALAMLVVLALNVSSGAAPMRLFGSAALLATFTLLGVFPDAGVRPRWATVLTLALMAVALGVQVLLFASQLT